MLGRKIRTVGAALFNMGQGWGEWRWWDYVQTASNVGVGMRGGSALGREARCEWGWAMKRGAVHPCDATKIGAAQTSGQKKGMGSKELQALGQAASEQAG